MWEPVETKSWEVATETHPKQRATSKTGRTDLDRLCKLVKEYGWVKSKSEMHEHWMKQRDWKTGPLEKRWGGAHERPLVYWIKS